MGYGLVVVLAAVGSAFAGRAADVATVVEWYRADKAELDLVGSSQASLLGFSRAGINTVSLTLLPREGGEGKFRVLKVVVDEACMNCLLLTSVKMYPALEKSSHQGFRFDADGSLARAFAGYGRTEEGMPVRGSAVDRVLDLEDPDVQDRAEQELAFWVRHVGAMTEKRRR